MDPLNFRERMVSIFEDYMKSAIWKNLVELVKTRDKCCVHCGATAGRFTAHHTDYTNWGKANKEELNDLVWLCNNCHNKTHSKGEVTVPFFATRKAANEEIITDQQLHSLYMLEL